MNISFDFAHTNITNETVTPLSPVHSIVSAIILGIYVATFRDLRGGGGVGVGAST